MKISSPHLAPLTIALLSLVWNPSHAADWPAWRGPKGTGVTSDERLLSRWGTNSNIRWRMPLPEAGNSTPIVLGDRVFIKQASEKNGQRSLMCFERKTGKLSWQQGPAFSGKELTHDTNPHGSASPVTDGERVIVWFGSAGLFSYDLNGK